MFSQRYLRWTTEVIGVDRIMCATDYPFPPIAAQGNRRLLAGSALDDADRQKIALGNWERLCAGIQRRAPTRPGAQAGSTSR